MNIDLSGKTALVTASSGSIGYAIVAGLVESHAEVIVNGRSSSSVDATLSRLQQQFPQARLRGAVAYMGSAEGVTALLDQVPFVDILVNNAGIYGPRDFYDTDDAVWENYWQTNVMSGVRLSRAFLPGMVAKQWGRVVFISSESARNIPADMIHYGVSKTAQLALARGLAKRVAGSGVTVNSVLPGPTISDSFATMMQDEVARTGKSLEVLAREFVMAHRPSSVIQRAASVEEVANMVVYICSQQASATSGAALRVDGGVVDDIL
ncbi:oxidoreductase [Candidatus Symbiopectobacterium sp. 'North America']|uniref:SDR family NAD(P)-dependent oxidoreductase n=1 Tax=Candidatus Symbiopectobacterium sp. 'North America' TaxID=2794574 RepID=UPI0018C992CA|nr:SDR family oxidoreductase [Candidatus Symbiopectobacterium sp. 'North America']MBG6243975.1 oxidoreductase [Candidatus Symbiopectobacterium sp. 'North America']